MARRKQPVIADTLLDHLLGGADPKTAFAKDGLLDELKKALAERAMNAEMISTLPRARARRYGSSPRSTSSKHSRRPNRPSGSSHRSR